MPRTRLNLKDIYKKAQLISSAAKKSASLTPPAADPVAEEMCNTCRCTHTGGNISVMGAPVGKIMLSARSGKDGISSSRDVGSCTSKEKKYIDYALTIYISRVSKRGYKYRVDLTVAEGSAFPLEKSDHIVRYVENATEALIEDEFNGQVLKGNVQKPELKDFVPLKETENEIKNILREHVEKADKGKTWCGRTKIQVSIEVDDNDLEPQAVQEICLPTHIRGTVEGKRNRKRERQTEQIEKKLEKKTDEKPETTAKQMLENKPGIKQEKRAQKIAETKAEKKLKKMALKKQQLEEKHLKETELIREEKAENKAEQKPENHTETKPEKIPKDLLGSKEDNQTDKKMAKQIEIKQPKETVLKKTEKDENKPENNKETKTAKITKKMLGLKAHNQLEKNQEMELVSDSEPEKKPIGNAEKSSEIKPEENVEKKAKKNAEKKAEKKILTENTSENKAENKTDKKPLKKSEAKSEMLSKKMLGGKAKNQAEKKIPGTPEKLPETKTEKKAAKKKFEENPEKQAKNKTVKKLEKKSEQNVEKLSIKKTGRTDKKPEKIVEKKAENKADKKTAKKSENKPDKIQKKFREKKSDNQEEIKAEEQFKKDGENKSVKSAKKRGGEKEEGIGELILQWKASLRQDTKVALKSEIEKKSESSIDTVASFFDAVYDTGIDIGDLSAGDARIEAGEESEESFYECQCPCASEVEMEEVEEKRVVTELDLDYWIKLKEY